MDQRERLLLEIIANTSDAERGLLATGKAADVASGFTQKLKDKLDDLSRKSAEARVALKGYPEALAQLDQLDLKIARLAGRKIDPEVDLEGAAKAGIEAAALDAKLSKLGNTAEKTAGTGGKTGLASLIGSGGIGGGGMMGVAVAAGTILSPVLVTLGTGFTGLAGAAYGVAKPLEQAAQKSGGLAKNLGGLDQEQKTVARGILGLGKQYDAFQKTLEPEILGAFSKGLQIAGHLLKDIQPVTIATGKAFDGFLGQLDKMFQSGEWQHFFQFMAATAAPDVKALGGLFIDLAKDIPPLIEALQPLAKALLAIADDAAKALHPILQLLDEATHKIQAHAHEWGTLGTAVHDAAKHATEWGPFQGIINWLGGDSLANAINKINPLARSIGTTGNAIAGLSRHASDLNDAFGRVPRTLPPATDAITRMAAANEKAFKAAGPVTDQITRLGTAGKDAAGYVKPLTDAITRTAAANEKAYKQAGPLTDAITRLASRGGDAAKAFTGAADDTQHYTGVVTKGYQPLLSMADAVRQLTTAMQRNDNTILTLQGDEVSWRQAVNAATQQLDSNKAGLKGNSNNALANKQAVLGATNAAQQFAEQQISTGGHLKKASEIIQDQIHWLEVHGGKSKFAAQEIRALRLEEDKLKNIRQQIAVSGVGRWNVVQSNLRGAQPGKSFGGAQGNMAAGGYISAGTGPTADDVHILASRGEYVTSAAAVSRYGRSFFDAVNAQRLAAGGVVGSFSGSVPGLTKWVGSEMNSTLTAMSASVAQAIRAGIAGMASSGFGATPGGGAPAANAALARRMYPAWGSGSEWAAWNAVAMRESGWSQFARNPSSGAYGIPQALPPSKMGPAANPPQSNPGAQIAWMISYIKSVYGDPVRAWAHELSAGWYDRGGYLPVGASIAVNTTGRPEPVGGARGPLVHVDTMVVQDATDAQKVAADLSFRIVTSGLG